MMNKCWPQIICAIFAGLALLYPSIADAQTSGPPSPSVYAALIHLIFAALAIKPLRYLWSYYQATAEERARAVRAKGIFLWLGVLIALQVVLSVAIVKANDVIWLPSSQNSAKNSNLSTLALFNLFLFGPLFALLAQELVLCLQKWAFQSCDKIRQPFLHGASKFMCYALALFLWVFYIVNIIGMTSMITPKPMRNMDYYKEQFRLQVEQHRKAQP